MTEPSRGPKRRFVGAVLPILLACAFFLAGGPSLGVGSPGAPTCTSSLQAEIDAASPGSTVVAAPCIYREQLVINKPIILRGQSGSEIRGSEVWGEWEQVGKLWRSASSLPEFPQTEVECMPGTKRCLWPEQVFFDGEPLRQVAAEPDAGQFAVDAGRRIILADDPRDRSVEVTVRRYWVLGKAKDVTIEGFTMRHAADGGRSGAIMNRMAWLDGGYAHWTVRDNVLSDAHGAVVSLTAATDLKIVDNEIYRGGQLGIKSTGRGEVIRGNEIHHNNTEGFNWRWEAGGLKTSGTQGVIVDSNEFHDNEGSAIWFDVDCSDNTISNNRIYHNTRQGIHYEISERAEIFGNVLWENGWGTPEWVSGSAISSANSSNVEIHHNILAWNADGVSVVGLDRDEARWDEVKNVTVHNNKILADDDPEHPTSHFALGWLQGWSDQMFEPESNNRGENNLYWYTAPEDEWVRYEWAKEKYASLKAFNATPGEEGGRYLTDAEKRRIVSEAGIPAAPEQRPGYVGLEAEEDPPGLLRALGRILNGLVSVLEWFASPVP